MYSTFATAVHHKCQSIPIMICIIIIRQLVYDDFHHHHWHHRLVESKIRFHRIIFNEIVYRQLFFHVRILIFLDVHPVELNKQRSGINRRKPFDNYSLLSSVLHVVFFHILFSIWSLLFVVHAYPNVLWQQRFGLVMLIQQSIHFYMLYQINIFDEHFIEYSNVINDVNRTITKYTTKNEENKLVKYFLLLFW